MYLLAYFSIPVLLALPGLINHLINGPQGESSEAADLQRAMEYGR